MTQDWPAPTANGPLHATVPVPGSKSITNRALVLAALSDGPSRITGGLVARDSDLMIAGLRALGVRVEGSAGDWQVHPAPLRGPATIDCGLAGTVMRFLPPVACLATGAVRLDGDPRARERPMGQLVESLAALGADIRATDGALPVVVQGRGALPGGPVTLDASASSQFVSGLLLAGARFGDGLTVHHVGEPVPSLPHIDMTVAMLAEHGVTVVADTADPARATWRVAPGPITARDRAVEPDLSNALPFVAAALVAGGEVTIPGWPGQSTQPGHRLPDLLTAMGAHCEATPDGLIVQGTGSVHGLIADLRDVGELTPVLAALAALADSPSRLTGIAHLRGHETDRLAALAHEINGLGGAVTELSDGLAIEPAPLHGGRFATYEDHRMATAGAVIGLAVPGITVENIATTAKTLPDFAAQWERMLTGGR